MRVSTGVVVCGLLAVCAVLFAGLETAYAEQSRPGSGSYLNGCGVTSTMSYKSHMVDGWNAQNPQWFVAASDPQFPRILNRDGTESINSAESQSNLRLVFGDIGDFRHSVSEPVPVFINGDLTDFGHGSERVATQEYFKELAPTNGAPLFFPGLGNHDYGNNVDDCANNGCARDSVCDVLKWTQELEPKSWDYHYAAPEHAGSFGYSVDVGPGATFIQLNDFPTYERRFESGAPLEKTEFNITPSLRWLEGALHDAWVRNRYVFINMHRRGGWSGDGADRFKRLVQGYGVQAVFAGHLHTELGKATGTEGNFGSVPVFQTGALLNRSYLIVEFRPDLKRYTVYKVEPGQGYRNKEKVGDFPLALASTIPAIDFSDAALVLYESNNATQNTLCELSIPYSAFNLPGPRGCTNDEARSLRILKAKKGTMIRLFGNWNHVKDQGYAFIYVIGDILLPVIVQSFDRNLVGDKWELARMGGGKLDGKVSSMSMLADGGAPPDRVEFFEGNNGEGDLVCGVTLPFPAHNLPGASGCTNDAVRSMRVISARKGTMIRLFGDWDHQKGQGYAFIDIRKDIESPIMVATFERNYLPPDQSWEITRHNGGTLDGKVSSISMLTYEDRHPSELEFYGDADWRELLCTVAVKDGTAFNMGEGVGTNCANDRVRAIKWKNAWAGYELCLFERYHQNVSGPRTCITVHKDYFSMSANRFNQDYEGHSGIYTQVNQGGMVDGLVSSVSVKAISRRDGAIADPNVEVPR